MDTAEGTKIDEESVTTTEPTPVVEPEEKKEE